jgi:hypothetical protein
MQGHQDPGLISSSTTRMPLQRCQLFNSLRKLSGLPLVCLILWRNLKQLLLPSAALSMKHSTRYALERDAVQFQLYVRVSPVNFGHDMISGHNLLKSRKTVHKMCIVRPRQCGIGCWCLGALVIHTLERSMQIPQRQWHRTPIVLLATAGLRMMAPGKAQALLQVCRTELHRSPFIFRDEWAAVLSGQAEGAYAWIAANYATGALQLVSSPHLSDMCPGYLVWTSAVILLTWFVH